MHKERYARQLTSCWRRTLEIKQSERENKMKKMFFVFFSAILIIALAACVPVCVPGGSESATEDSESDTEGSSETATDESETTTDESETATDESETATGESETATHESESDTEGSSETAESETYETGSQVEYSCFNYIILR